MQHNNVISIIGIGVSVAGGITGAGDVRIDGKVEGDVITTGTVIVGEEGVVLGRVEGHDITISGLVDGGVIATGKATIGKKGVLRGNLTAKLLVIEEGAKFTGLGRTAE